MATDKHKKRQMDSEKSPEKWECGEGGDNWEDDDCLGLGYNTLLVRWNNKVFAYISQ